jgi:small redox-active disulfide protein 2
MEIKILGTGCARCASAEEVIKEAVAESGLPVRLEKVTDLLEIATYGVLGMPAVIVDGRVKCVGKVPKKEDVKAWLKE